MGFWGNSNDAEVTEEQDADTQEEDDSYCSINIYFNHSEPLSYENLSRKDVDALKRRLNIAMSNRSIEDLSDLGYNAIINTALISYIDWNDGEDE